MKKTIKMFLLTFLISAACTQAILITGDLLGIKQLRYRNVGTLIYLSCLIITTAVDMKFKIQPFPPYSRMSEVMETEGYSYRYYALLKDWYDICIKRGYRTDPQLLLSEALIKGGHISEGLEILEKVKIKKSDRIYRQRYYGILLYTAVMCGERTAADEIYKRALPWLSGLDGGNSEWIKYILGCYEYMRGDLKKAERLFLQSLDGEPGNITACNARLALTLCYLDSGRYEMAKISTDIAARYAKTLPLRGKVERVRTLVENEFRKIRAKA